MPDMRSLLIIDQTLQKMLNDYLLLPGAEGLVPLNPTRLPSYIGGVILSQDLNKTRFVNSISKIFFHSFYFLSKPAYFRLEKEKTLTGVSRHLQRDFKGS